MGGCCSFTLLGLKAFTESLEHREVVDGGTVTEPFAPSRGAAEVTLDLLMGCLACL